MINEKQIVIKDLLSKDNVFIHLDPRKEGVVVPLWLSKQPHLVLEIGYDMMIQIPDLEVGEGGITATLSFDRSPFTCFVPYTSIFAAHNSGDTRIILWKNGVPVEMESKTKPILKLINGESIKNKETAPKEEVKHPHLKFVK